MKAFPRFITRERARIVERCSGFVLAAVLLCSPASAQWFVDVDNLSGTEDGLTWATAFTTIQPAIDAAADAGGGEVWVAAGVYDEARERVIVYEHSSGTEIYNTGSLVVLLYVTLLGGFSGSKSDASQRDWVNNPTVISGTTSRDGQPAYHVVEMVGDGGLDGFTVTGGNSVPTVRTRPEERTAAAIFATSGGASILNVVVTGNTGRLSPSIVHIESGLCENITLFENVSTLTRAAQLFAVDTTVRDSLFSTSSGRNASFEGASSIENCRFEHLVNGGVVLGGDSVMSGCTFEFNEASDDIAAALEISGTCTIVETRFLNNFSTEDYTPVRVTGEPVHGRVVLHHNDVVRRLAAARRRTGNDGTGRRV